MNILLLSTCNDLWTCVSGHEPQTVTPLIDLLADMADQPSEFYLKHSRKYWLKPGAKRLLVEIVNAHKECSLGRNPVNLEDVGFLSVFPDTKAVDVEKYFGMPAGPDASDREGFCTAIPRLHTDSSRYLKAEGLDHIERLSQQFQRLAQGRPLRVLAMGAIPLWSTLGGNKPIASLAPSYTVRNVGHVASHPGMEIIPSLSYERLSIPSGPGLLRFRKSLLNLLRNGIMTEESLKRSA